jgi:hypothetical protein
MGLTRRGALAAVGTALLLLAASACTGDESDHTAPRTDEGAATESSSTTEADGGDLIGGSRYLAYSRLSAARDHDQLVVEDLLHGTEEVVTTTDMPTYIGTVAVSAEGAIAWAQTLENGETLGVTIRSSPTGAPVRVDAEEADCPHWIDDGTLLVTTFPDSGDPALAVVEPSTGASEVLPVELGGAVCAVPAGADQVVFPRPVGRRTYGSGGAEIIRISLDGTGEEVVGHIPSYCWANDLAVSPDGSALAAGVYCGPEVTADEYGLYVGTMGDDLTPLVAENGHGDAREDAFQYWGPTWSADGTVVGYYRTEPRSRTRLPHIWVADPTGGRPIEHSAGGSPALSPPEGSGRD